MFAQTRFTKSSVLVILSVLLSSFAPAAAGLPGPEPLGPTELSVSALVAPQAVTQLAISEVEINQVIGKQKDGNLNFVAGKDTVVLAYMSEAVTVDPANTEAVIKRDGNVVVTLAPKSYDNPVNVVEFLCPNREACGNWAAGVYTFDVNVNGVTKSEPPAGTTYTYRFQERGLVRILVLPVKARYGSVITQVEGDKWKKDGQYTQRVYPLAPDMFKWDIRDEFDASDPKYDLETDNGQLELWQALSNLMPQECASNPKGAGCYELIVGFVSDRPKGYPNGTLQGYTYGKPTNIVVARDQDSEATVAHEIAHVYGVGDTYDGGSFHCSVNPAPTGYKGTDWDTRQQTQCVPGAAAYPDVSASLIPASVHPYEVGGRGALGDMACYMGSGGLQNVYWTTPDAYDWLFPKLAPTMLAAAANAPERVVNASGSIYMNGTVDLEPWYSFTGTASISVTSPYAIVAMSDTTELARLEVAASFFVHTNPPTTTNPAPFEAAMPFPYGTTAFHILSGTQMLQVVTVTAHSPVVTITAPLANVTASDLYTVTWDATDEDGDTLEHTVEYSLDGQEWEVLIGELDANQWPVDFSDPEVPGGNAVRLRVRTTDGVNAALATSVPFTVPVKSPEVFIDEPEAGQVFDYGSEVTLNGVAYDPQDGELADAKLTWSSSQQGALGTGGLVYVSTLKPGQHVITLTATNSLTKTSVATTTITIGHPMTPDIVRKTAAPGQTVTYTLRVTNTAAIADSYVLTYTESEWPVQIVTGSPLLLDSGSSSDVVARVSVPTTTASLSDEVYVLAISQNVTGTLILEPVTASSLLVTSMYRLYLPLIMR